MRLFANTSTNSQGNPPTDIFDLAKENGISPHQSPRTYRAFATCVQTSGHLMTIAEEVAAGALADDTARQFLRYAARSLPKAMKAVEDLQKIASR